MITTAAARKLSDTIYDQGLENARLNKEMAISKLDCKRADDQAEGLLSIIKRREAEKLALTALVRELAGALMMHACYFCSWRTGEGRGCSHCKPARAVIAKVQL